jgi:hypothetical protein
VTEYAKEFLPQMKRQMNTDENKIGKTRIKFLSKCALDVFAAFALSVCI